MSAVNRYSSRSSYMSETSSINETDSASQLNASKFETYNEDDEYNTKDDDDNVNNNNNNEIKKEPVKSTIHLERNTRLTSSIRNTKPQSASTPSIQTRLPHNEEPVLTKIVTHVKSTAPVAPVTRQNSSQSTSPTEPLPLNDSFASIFTEAIQKQQQQQQQPPVETKRQAPTQPSPSSSSVSIKSVAPVPQQQRTINDASLNASRTTMRKFENSFTTNGDDSDIEWASSDEEIVKQEIETFERNQVFIKKKNFFFFLISKLCVSFEEKKKKKKKFFFFFFFCYHAFTNKKKSK
jgi:hypothetical protein